MSETVCVELNADDVVALLESRKVFQGIAKRVLEKDEDPAIILGAHDRVMGYDAQIESILIRSNGAYGLLYRARAAQYVAVHDSGSDLALGLRLLVPHPLICELEGCGQPIGDDVVFTARFRGEIPKYHSKTCRDTDAKRRQRERQRSKK